MDLLINSQLLAAELRLLNKIVASKPALPILGNVLLRADQHLSFSTTDLEVGLSTQCAATITTPGTITLPVKKLLDIIEQLPSADVHIVVDNHQVRLSSGAFKSRLQSMPVADFPSFPTVEGTSVSLPAKALRTLIDKTRYAIADTTQKFVVNGALLSLADATMAMVTTDGKRLSISTTARAAGSNTSALLPSKTLDTLLSYLTDGDVEFSQSDHHLFFQVGDRVLFSRMLDGQFPKYDRIVPRDHPHKAVIDRSMLTAAIKRVGLVSGDNKAAYFSFAPSSLSLSTNSAEIGDADEQMLIDYAGPEIKISMSWAYVLDFLEAASEQSITMTIKDSLSAVLLSDGTDFLNVVMVMRTA